MKLRKHLPIVIFVGAAVFFILHCGGWSVNNPLREGLDLNTMYDKDEPDKSIRGKGMFSQGGPAGKIATFTAPAGSYFTKITMDGRGGGPVASYAAPHTKCPMSTNVKSVLESACVGKSTCTIPISDSTFNVSCPGEKYFFIGGLDYEPIASTPASTPASTGTPITVPPADNTKYIAYGIIGVTVLAIVWAIYSVSSVSSPVAPVVAGRRR